LRLAVASPFVDRRHGTERAVAELIERLSEKFGCEIELYAQRVDDFALSGTGTGSIQQEGRIHWRRVPSLPGPHLLRFAGWYLFNFWRRQWDRRARGARFDRVFSPGINCSDANVILVHAVFHRLEELQRNSARGGFRGLHRRLYYGMLCFLERRIYTRKNVTLAAVSRHTAVQLKRYFGRSDVTVIPDGVDTQQFRPGARLAQREGTRDRWRLSRNDRALLLVGNDWRNKGLDTLLQATALCKELPIRLLIVGQDDPGHFAARVDELGLAKCVEFAPPSPDILPFYAAADIVVAPSLEDSFNLPALEAMACGLPVIVSPEAGISEWVTHGQDAVLLKNPKDARELAEAIRGLANDPGLAARIGENAVRTASTLTWDRHAEAVFQLLSQIKKR
jgi:UDP-glucose:(heptosyl)LPS alpha-1,3-glucosyltransferase